MSGIDENILLKLEFTPKEIYFTGVEILLKLLNNIINDPNNKKFRTIRIENEIIKNKLLPLNGIHELLLKIGFEPSDNGYYLPSNVLLSVVKDYRDFVLNRFNIQKGMPSTSSYGFTSRNSALSKNLQQQPKIVPSRMFLERTSFPRVLDTANPLLNLIEKHSDLIMQYDDQNLKQYARGLIPIDRLRLNATKRLRKIQNEIIGKKKEKNDKRLLEEPCFNDLFLIELVNWFKTEFFEWINTVPCKVCGKDDNLNASKTSDIENGLRVEIIFCCNQQTKFYRYKEIEKLLQTRKGRCGEFADCFTFLCHALGYNSRLVVSQFDHVWTEVYSSSQERWLHIDPSENVIDSPLMYQYGWKRTIDYVMAYSIDDIQDVTWRYTNTHIETLNLRDFCSEEELLNTIRKIRAKRQMNLSDCKRQYLIKRTLKELVELMVERMPTEDEKRGRSSGSLAWRQERGETINDNFYNFQLIKEEIRAKQFNLRYSCVKDVYERYIKEGDNIKILWTQKGWQNCQFLSKNIFRKVEKDWKMVYLAREEGTSCAEITWKFNFSNTNLIINKYSLKFETKTYENGKILVEIINDNDYSENIIGSNKFTIKVKLMEGIGDVAWQHTQLFRQNLNSCDFPFDLNIIFN